MKERSYRSVLWTLALVGFVLDQATKYGIFAWLYNDSLEGKRALIPGAFELLAQFTGVREGATSVLGHLRTLGGEMLPRVNHGALFGMASGSGQVANAVFAGISLLAAAAIVYWSTRKTLAEDGLLCTALGLILGGTLGNFYDRLVFGGVRDFLHWYYAFEWPVFNIADCCLVVGAFLLLVQALWAHPVTDESEPAATVAPPVESEVSA